MRLSSIELFASVPGIRLIRNVQYVTTTIDEASRNRRAPGRGNRRVATPCSVNAELQSGAGTRVVRHGVDARSRQLLRQVHARPQLDRAPRFAAADGRAR